MACNLYKVPSELTPATIIYTDCDGVDQVVSVPGGGDYYFCSTSIISGPPEIELIGLCSCNCFAINVTSGATIDYYDCDNNQLILNLSADTINPIYTFCASQVNTTSVPFEPIIKDCLTGSCDSNPTCYTFTPSGETSVVKYFDINGDIAQISNPTLEVNICSRGVITYLGGNLINSNNPCTSNTDCNDCGCYEFTSNNIDNEIRYVECDGITTVIDTRINFINFCSNGTISLTGGTLVNNGLCVDGFCIDNCYCYTIDTNGASTTLSYIECDNSLGAISLVSSSTKICAQSIVNPDPNWTITKGELCLDAQYCLGDCECYLFTNKFDDIFVEYIDCNDVILTGYTSGASIDYPAILKICSKSILNIGAGMVEYNLGSCTNSICNTSFCDCYTIPENVGAYNVTYLNCDDNVVTIENTERTNPKISFCAQVILDTSTNLITKGYPCIYGQCPTTKDLLTQKLNSLRGPCPEVCDGSKKIGGVTGTDEINIITQKPL